MNIKHFALVGGLCLSTAITVGQTPAPDHLVISEMGVYAPSGYSNAPGSAEFTEIYNPTNTTIDLSNYYISDFERYFDLPAIVALQTDNLLANGSDFLLKFPDGSSIPPGGVVVVTNSATQFAKAYFDDDLDNFLNQAGSPQLFETWGGVHAGTPDPEDIILEDPRVPQMGTNYNKTSIDYPLDRGATAIADTGSNMSHTDAGEYCVLFTWDGVGPLVQDVDIVQYRPKDDPWGDNANQVRDKSGQPGVGPGPDYPTDTYKTDAGFVNGEAVYLNVDYGDGPRGQMVRRSLLEAGETRVDGNGVTGDDETLEFGNLTWEMVLGAPMNASPGTTDLTMSADNQPPVVGESIRNIQNPSPGDTVHITAPVFDEGPVTVKLWVDKGTGYTAVNMTSEGNDIYGADISTNGLAEGTRVRFYAEATDSDGVTRSEADYKALPDSTPNTDDWPGYNVFMVKSTPYQPGDFIVSEIMYNPKDHNNSWHAQFIELYNPGTEPVDISDMRLSTDSYFDSGNGTVAQLPSNAVIPPQGYYTIAGNKVVFLRDFPGMDPDTVADFGMVPSQSFMAHEGSKFLFFDPNVYGFDDDPITEADAFKTMEYGNGTPWPEGATGQDPTAGNKGYDIELTELTYAAEEDPSKWAIGTILFGTPNATNSVLRTGDVLVSGVTRSVQYPTTSDSISISATVSSTTPISTVELFVDSGSGFGTGIPMTTTDNVTYSASVGPFTTDNTIVYYYIVATDTSNNTGGYPAVAPVSSIPFIVQNNLVKGGYIINEIMYDPAGTDNGTNSEYVELYNPTSEPIDLSLHVVTRNNLNNTAPTDRFINSRMSRPLPIGTMIPAEGYLVLAPRRDLMVDTYVSAFTGYQKDRWGALEADQVIDLAWDDASALANGDNTAIEITHPNDVDYSNTVEFVPYISLNYLRSSPWPANGTTLNLNSIELKDTVLDFFDATNWAVAIAFRGTPGTRNSVAPPPSSVTDWSMY